MGSDRLSNDFLRGRLLRRIFLDLQSTTRQHKQRSNSKRMENFSRWTGRIQRNTGWFRRGGSCAQQTTFPQLSTLEDMDLLTHCHERPIMRTYLSPGWCSLVQNFLQNEEESDSIPGQSQKYEWKAHNYNHTNINIFLLNSWIAYTYQIHTHTGCSWTSKWVNGRGCLLKLQCVPSHHDQLWFILGKQDNCIKRWERGFA